MPDTQCPVCSNVLNETSRVGQKWDTEFYDCPQCGKYKLEDLAKDSRNFHDSKQLISAWIRRENNRLKRVPFINDLFVEEDWFKNLRNMGFPQTVNEKMNELLKAYAELVIDDYNQFIPVQQHLELVADIAAKNLEEIIGLNRLLEELGYIECAKENPKKVRLTANGWLRIDDLSKSISTSDSAFIAMWFDPQTNDCREAIKEAVSACGYKPVIVNEAEFNNFIMDEVITLIRQAHFLIADLTCIPEDVDVSNSKVTGGVRGGVYWEAGMAYGMEKTVIQTCRDDTCSLERIHFDLNQYTTIRWEAENLKTSHIELYNHVDNPSFAQELATRIMRTVGKGNYTSSSE